MGARAASTDLAARDALAVADDAPVVGIGGDQLGGTGTGAGTPRRGSACGRGGTSSLAREREAGVAQAVDDVLGDRHRRRQAGRADAADADVALRGMERDLVVAVLGGGAQADVDGRDLLVEQRRQDAAALLAAGSPGPRRSTRSRVLSAMSSAVGPSTTLPNTVGLTSTPLLTVVGTGSRMWLHQRARELVEDDQLAAPRRDGERGVAEAGGRCVSAYRPAALTT